MSYAERVADPDDSLRHRLQAARSVRIPPTIFMRRRTVETPWWTDEDTSLTMALANYEAQCDDRGHYLPETTKPEHADAYRPGEPIHCHKCRAESLFAEVTEKAAERGENSAGVMVPLVLDPDVVALNKLPVPPLPPELAAIFGE